MKNAATISKRNDDVRVVGDFFVTYSAQRFGKKYTTTHLSPCNTLAPITADGLNEHWQAAFKGLCPFNGDEGFQVVKIQQRTI